ncbi:hypothetical protein [Pseudomonas sp. TNT2022 ID642]|uniref:hypothetical protein n=1 Tax=Pseudomonas sp. TNT2022 ID642 TaxID=2942632 RepID=UPI00235F2B5E|nr:hypothetical protein [Pseudomonas sp. TNT2022 ID642]MDD1002394.1 hypothetical protein [Pseudomonas sp. TNT2022 ID642]
MKSKRKLNNGFARAERSCRALLRTNHVAVVNIDPSGSQIMANWKSCRQIRSLAIAIPDEISMDEAQAAKLFYAAGAWHQVKVAA